MIKSNFSGALGRLFFLALLTTVSIRLDAQAAEVSFTIDDPYTSDTVKLTGEERDAAIRKHLRDAHLKAALFVCGMRIDSQSGKNLLQAWDQEGHLIANHSYSHKYFNSHAVSAEFLKADIIKAEALLSSLQNFHKLFRFPFLKEGETAQKRDAIRDFLAKNSYRSGAVTIDASDWYVSERLLKRLQSNPNADATPYRDFYLKHIWDRTNYYDTLAKEILGREIKHTLLIHHNLLNALFLGDLIKMFHGKGWKTIHAPEAFQDAVFTRAPNIVPAGESLIWGLAKETGNYEGKLRYPGEDGEYEKAEMDQLGL